MMNVPDPFGSMANMVRQYQGFLNNPIQFLAQRQMRIPQDVQNNPQAIVQHLLNNGQMTQQQLNGLQQMANQIQGNPQFQQLMNKNNV